MFDFEKLEVYQKARAFNKLITGLLKTEKRIDRVSGDQLRRAALSIMLNIAEGCSRFSKPDRRNYFVVSRGSAFECAAVIDYLSDDSIITDEFKSMAYLKLDELSRMLFGLIKNL